MTLPQPNGSTPNRLLLVEGNDDLRFFQEFARYIGTSELEISSYHGKFNLGNDLSNRVRSAGFQAVSSLGIVRDADESSRSAFDSVVGSLQRANLPVPNAPIIPTEHNGLRISVLIVPPGDDEGELEDVCLRSVEGYRDMECVESYINCLQNTGPPIASNRLAKARLHSYLAIGPVHENDGNALRMRPALRLGEAAEAGLWDWSSPAFQELAEFLRGL